MYSPIIRQLNTATPKNVNFPFGIYAVSMVLSVPILKHFRVFTAGLTSRVFHSLAGSKGIQTHDFLNHGRGPLIT